MSIYSYVTIDDSDATKAFNSKYADVKGEDSKSAVRLLRATSAWGGVDANGQPRFTLSGVRVVGVARRDVKAECTMIVRDAVPSDLKVGRPMSLCVQVKSYEDGTLRQENWMAMINRLAVASGLKPVKLEAGIEKFAERQLKAFQKLIVASENGIELQVGCTFRQVNKERITNETGDVTQIVNRFVNGVYVHETSYPIVDSIS